MAEQIEPVIPVSEEPTAAETAVGVGVTVVLVSAAVLLLSLAAVVNEAAE